MKNYLKLNFKNQAQKQNLRKLRNPICLKQKRLIMRQTSILRNSKNFQATKIERFALFFHAFFCEECGLQNAAIFCFQVRCTKLNGWESS